MKKTNLYDLYVIKTNGIPIFAGCSGSEYCQNHMDQHELHAAFFSALYTFAKEAFQDIMLETIYFDQIQMNILVDTELDLLYIFVHHKDARIRRIRKQLIKTQELIKYYYWSRIDENREQPKIFQEFIKDLVRLRILQPTKIFNTGDMLLKVEKPFSLLNK